MKRYTLGIAAFSILLIWLLLVLFGCEPAGYPTAPKYRCESEKREVFAQYGAPRAAPSDSLLRQDLWRIGSKTLLFRNDCSVSNVTHSRPTP